jgi:hypothetical protein
MGGLSAYWDKMVVFNEKVAIVAMFPLKSCIPNFQTTPYWTQSGFAMSSPD